MHKDQGIGVSHVESIGKIESLESLVIDQGEYSYGENSSITDISPFENLKNLEELILEDNCYLESIKPISELENLEVLDLRNNSIEKFPKFC